MDSLACFPVSVLRYMGNSLKLGESGELGTVVLLAHALMSNALILLRSSYASWSLPCIFSASLLIRSNSGKRGQAVTELW